MRLLVSFFATSLLAVNVSSCGNGSLTDSQTIARQLAGTWVEPVVVAGVSFDMVLTTHGSDVTGTGTYSFEAGHSGNTTVTGTVAGTTIDLDVAFDGDQTRHFRGKLDSPLELRGTWYVAPAGDPVDVGFDKVQ